jgi:hypothetical protein
MELGATVSTTKLQPGEPNKPEEGECLFHSHMWVKGNLLHFIIDSGIHNKLISAEVIKKMGLPTTSHPEPYTIGWLRQWKRYLRKPIVSNVIQNQALER